MNNKVFVLKNVADFAPGAFENTLVEAGCIQLGRNSGTYLHSGCYISPTFQPGRFTRLIPSWNADCPPGTAVEVQVRVVAGGQWSRWFSFGRWSPFINRSSPEPQSDSVAHTEAEWLVLSEEYGTAEMAQIKIYLYTNEPQSSPLVRLLSVTASCENTREDKEVFVDRELQIPTYSCLVRDPSLALRIPGATSLCMLMNRWGEDVLPEEAARAGYDCNAGRYGNLSFIAAVGGAYGYECYIKYATLNFLRNEVRKSRAVAAMVHYRPPALDGNEPELEEGKKAHPVLPGAHVMTAGHLVVVRGFVWRGSQEYVVMNDPMMPNDGAVRCEVAIEKFTEIYMGLCLVLHKGAHHAGKFKPMRIVTQVKVENDDVVFSSHGEALLPGANIPGDSTRSTICYTLSDGVLYASAAQKKFYYMDVKEPGKLTFDHKTAVGKKVTFYLIGSRGATWVGEKNIEN